MTKVHLLSFVDIGQRDRWLTGKVLSDTKDLDNKTSEGTLFDFGKIPSNTKDLDSITSERTLFGFGEMPRDIKDLDNSITYI